jgi:hypothetical protein
MRKIIIAFAAVVTILNVPAVGDACTIALPPAHVQVTIGDSTVLSVPAVLNSDGKTYSLELRDLLFDGAGLSVLTYSADPDPFVSYVISVQNFTAVALSFSAFFGSTYVGGPYGEFESWHSSTVTDGDQSGTMSVAPFVKTTVHTPTLDGSDVLAAALGDGCSFTSRTAGATEVCDPLATVVGPVATGASGVFGVLLSFTLSAGDAYAASGRIELRQSTVPEPATLPLILTALLVVGVRARRMI